MLLVAHRTPPSRAECARLAAAGAQLFEADVQVDDDDRIVVSHYFPVDPLGLLQRDNWRLRWRTRSAQDAGLGDVAAVVPDGGRLLLDLKERTPARRGRLLDAIISSPIDHGRLVACSARREDLARLRAAGLRTWRTVGDRRELANVLVEGRLPDAAVTVRHTLLSEALVQRLHDQVPTVVAWTVNRPDRARRLQAMGVDGITTDRVAVLQFLTVGS